MILDEFIDIKISGSKQITIYSKLGFKCEMGDTIHCPIEKLSLGSHLYIRMTCDFCGKEITKQYNTYNNQTNNGELPISCMGCINEKRKFSIKKKYNVDNISQLNETKEKIKKNNNDKYGVDYYMQTEEFKESVKNTNNEKYGVDWIPQTNLFKEKSKKTNQEKYGTDFAIQSDIIKNRSKETCLSRYNKDSYMKTDDFRKKSKEKNQEKYGTDYASQSDTIKEKIKQTNLTKFGVEYPSQTNEIKEKIKQTNLTKYGVEYTPQSDIVKEKMKNSNLNKYGSEYYSQSKIFKSIIKNRKIPHLKEKFDINVINIENNIIEYHCDKCGKNSKSDYQLLYNRMVYKTVLCENCNPINSAISGEENQLLNFIKNNYSGNTLSNIRNVISPYELDIYLPDFKLAFEYNGLFWHNEFYTENNYHLNKTEQCEKQGIHLIHIYEDDWLYKTDIVKSRILNLLGITPIKIYARKCEIKEINDNKLLREFLETNHMQGFVGSQIKLGLFYNDELVSLMTFGKQRKSMGIKNKINSYEMLRFCNKLNTSVIGGADRLFKYFINTYKPVEVVSYADRSWSRGDLYYKLRFDYISKTPPNYYYIVDGIRKYRFNFRKDLLIKEGFDVNKTEHQIMLERGIYRIYDSGSLKFKYHPYRHHPDGFHSEDI